MNRKNVSDFDPKVLQIYDQYVHSSMSRRDFIDRVSSVVVGGISALTIVESLLPDYALASQVAPDDKRIIAQYWEYDSPQGHGKMKGLMAKPQSAKGKLPGVIVIHENRGLNPYIEDVVRRLGVAGYLAFAPDALTPLGGYPGSDDEGKIMQRKLDRKKVTEDFVAATKFLHDHPLCNGNVGAVGFCFGGGMANTLAVRLPFLKAAVPFYGRQPKPEDVAKIKATILVHNAELDKRVNDGWPAYEKALQANAIKYQAYMYSKANHGFHNDTTPRYDERAAKLAWDRTLAFFATHLVD